jgi:hypothetical protein
MSSYAIKQKLSMNYGLIACLAVGMSAAVIVLGNVGSAAHQLNMSPEGIIADSGNRNGSGDGSAEPVRLAMLQTSGPQNPSDDSPTETAKGTTDSVETARIGTENNIARSQAPPQKHSSEINADQNKQASEAAGEPSPLLKSAEDDAEKALAAQDNATAKLGSDVQGQTNHDHWMLTVLLLLCAAVGAGLIFAKRPSGWKSRQRGLGLSDGPKPVSSAPGRIAPGAIL